jgi:hypothetical protein
VFHLSWRKRKLGGATPQAPRPAALFYSFETHPNDYIGWITRAKREATVKKRLKQMLDELEQGDVYMKMAWEPGRHRL